ncbi:MAG: hypothetical protein A3F12_07795 [Gammaproteobacteria bacterium RIFCSPHIGHO2_12_FULL_38_14]|nr:MAG: hypothetical protein A3F12_07795 [Gammaproteobacteria bacterium RIFCSPHIGHO2_12_FULL_38_14]
MNFIKKIKKYRSIFLLLSILFTVCLSSQALAVQQPLTFTAQPSFPQTVAQSATYTLNYTIKNNIPRITVPLSFSATVTAGTIADSGGTCGSSLSGNTTCTKTFLFTAPSSGQTVTGEVSVVYNSRYPLTDNTLSFTIPSVAAPTITSLDTTSGTTAGGTSVVITGTNFTDATAVTFGGTAASSYTVNSATQITATTPAHAAGAVDVAVTTAGGTATSLGGYTYQIPISVTEPSLMFVTTASSGTITYRGTLTVTNNDSTEAAQTITATPSSGSGITQSATTCGDSLSAGSSCTFTFTSSLPVNTAGTVAISGTNTSTVTNSVSAISVTAFSPPVNATNNAALMLVAGCSSIPEVLQVTNLSNAAVSSITATATAANWSSSRNPTITNGCSGVSLAAYSSSNGADVCSLSVVPNGSAASGDNGTITVSGTNTNTAGIIAAVENNTAIPTSGPTAVTLGSALPGTSPTEKVIFLNQTCNLVKVAANANQSGSIAWDPAGTPTSTGGTSTAGNLGQTQSILAIHTVGITESQAANTYAAGLCTPSQLNQNNAVTWYLPSVGSGTSTDPAIIATNGDELGLVMYYGVNNSNTDNTAAYWSSTESSSTFALLEYFGNGLEAQGPLLKADDGSVRCARALTY